MPTISRQDLDNTHLHLTITLSREDLKPKLDSEFKKLRQRASVKGFRSGQAPVQYVKSLYGASLFYDVFNKMISDELYAYLREQELDVLGQPLPLETQEKYTFKIDNPEPEYSVAYEIGHVPKFEITGLSKDQEYDRYEPSDLDTLAEADLEEMRKKAGGRTSPEDDILEEDIIKVNSKEMDGDQAKVDGWETTVTVFVKSIEDATLKANVLKMKKGDILRFDVNQLEENRNETFVRKYLLGLPDEDTREVGNVFEGVIEEVTRVAPADLTAEFLQSNFGEDITNVDDAKEALKKNILGFYENRANALVFRDMQERLLTLNKVELPEQFLKRWLILSNEGVVSAESVDKEYEQFAYSLRWSMLRDRLIAQFGVEVSEEEIRAEFLNTLNGYFRSQLPYEILKDGIERMMKDKKEVDRVTSNIEYEKMFSAALKMVTIKPKPITSEGFHAIFDAARQMANSQSALENG